MSLTAERLRELLHYDPKTGVFTWVKRISIRAPVGRTAGYDQGGYTSIGVDGRPYLAHRLAWLYVNGVWPTRNIDHINLDRKDNRIANLRECNQSQNLCNIPVRRNNKTGYKGVSFHSQAKKWRASIRINGQNTHLGLFSSAEQAAQAYQAAARKHHGEFARFA